MDLALAGGRRLPLRLQEARALSHPEKVVTDVPVDLEAAHLIERRDFLEAVVPPINAVTGNLQDLLAHPALPIAAVILVDEKRVTGIEKLSRSTQRLDLGVFEVELDRDWVFTVTAFSIDLVECHRLDLFHPVPGQADALPAI